jgi:outer membrane protein assembly factor BamB
VFHLELTTVRASVGRGLALPFAAYVAAGSTLLGAASNSDWPQLLGPQRDGIYLGPPIAKAWSKEGPPVVWKREVGSGLAGPAVSGERLILFHRMENRAVVECLDTRTGKPMWKAGYATDYRDDFGFDEGPRATPTIADGRVFTFGAEGRASCWKLETGDPLWNVDAAKEFQSPKGFFGRAASPLVEGDLVILLPGGRDGAGVVALDVATGKVRWKATGDEASYASPTVATIRERKIIFALTREALVALQPTDGQVIFRHPWRPRGSATVTAATPLVVDDLIFLSASYGAGARLLRFKERGPEEIWSRDDALSNHYATSVQHGGFLYGWHGRQEQGCELRCVELKTGKVRWSEEGLRAGSVTLAGDDLLLLTERGLLIRAPATPEGFKPATRVQILPSDVRAYPALANGFLFARSKEQLTCLDLRKEP